MKRAYFLIGAFLLIWLGTLVTSMGGAGAQDQIKPTVVPAEFLTPVPTPPDSRQVAILTLTVVSSPEGKLEKISLEQGKIAQGYAPNVLERSGDWTVVLTGEQKLEFGVPDPRRVDVFPGPNEKIEGPHQTELLTEVTWDLVVPLYLFDQDLVVKTIHIFDQDQNLIFSTEVDREGWK